MKHLTIYIILISCLTSCQRKSPIHKSPASIAMKIYEINKRVPLSPETQARLATFFIHNDSLANVALQRGDSIANIISTYYDLNFDTISTLLNSEERNNYLLAFTPKKEKYVSNLRHVIRHKKVLELSKQQIERLLTASKKIEESFETKQGHYKDDEKKFMKSILSKEQQRKFYIEQNVAAVRRWTLEQIAQCQKIECFRFPQDSTRLYSLFFDYELNKRGTLDYLSNTDSKELQKEKDRLNAYKPMELVKLEVYTKKSFYSKLLDLICKRKEAGISERQINALLNEYIKIKQIIYISTNEKQSKQSLNFDSKELENKSIFKNISTSQLDKYFHFICQEGVKKRARKHWEDIQQYDFSHKLDSIQTLKELENYEMRLAIANQWISLEQSRKNLFAKEDILCSKPKCLMLEEQWKKKKKEESIIKF